MTDITQINVVYAEVR